MTPEVEQELAQVLNSSYVRKYEGMYTTETEKIQNSWRADHHVVPDFIDNQHLLKIRIADMAQEVFG